MCPFKNKSLTQWFLKQVSIFPKNNYRTLKFNLDKEIKGIYTAWKKNPFAFKRHSYLYRQAKEFFLIPGISEFDKVAVYKENPKNH